MLLGKVIGRVILSEQDKKLKGKKLMILQLLDENKNAIGSPVISVDTVGAGNGELVLICEGDESMLSFPEPIPPADLGIVGIIDNINIDQTKIKKSKYNTGKKAEDDSNSYYRRRKI